MLRDGHGAALWAWCCVVGMVVGTVLCCGHGAALCVRCYVVGTVLRGGHGAAWWAQCCVVGMVLRCVASHRLNRLDFFLASFVTRRSTCWCVYVVSAINCFCKG